MFRRFVVRKINEQINCYQGILVTLGTKMLSNKLSETDMIVARSIFAGLKTYMPEPALDQDMIKNSVSWLKIHSESFNDCVREMNRTSSVLESMGYEVLILETTELEGVIYEDSVQVLTEAGRNTFRITAG